MKTLIAVLTLAGSIQLAVAGSQVERKLGQVPLDAGMEQAQAHFKAAEASSRFKEAISAGETMLVFRAPFIPKGASGMVGHVYKKEIWRLEASFPPEYCRKLTWTEFLKSPIKNYGKPLKISKSVKPEQEKYIWEDARTILTYTRDVSREKRGLPTFYISVEDRAVWDALYPPAKAALAKAP